MARFYSGEIQSIDTNHCVADLTFVCFLGSICGILCFFRAEASVVSVMRGMVLCPVSIVGRFCIHFIPFLFTAYAVFVSELRLLYLICFCKSFLHCFVLIAVCVAFGSAGWLVRNILLICATAEGLYLFVLWVRLLSGGKFSVFADTILFALFSVLICAADHYIITPFLAGLIEI